MIPIVEEKLSKRDINKQLRISQNNLKQISESLYSFGCVDSERWEQINRLIDKIVSLISDIDYTNIEVG